MQYILSHSAKGKEWKSHKYIKKVMSKGKWLYYYGKNKARGNKVTNKNAKKGLQYAPTVKTATAGELAYRYNPEYYLTGGKNFQSELNEPTSGYIKRFLRQDFGNISISNAYKAISSKVDWNKKKYRDIRMSISTSSYAPGENVKPISKRKENQKKYSDGWHLANKRS